MSEFGNKTCRIYASHVATLPENQFQLLFHHEFGNVADALLYCSVQENISLQAHLHSFDNVILTLTISPLSKPYTYKLRFKGCMVLQRCFQKSWVQTSTCNIAQCQRYTNADNNYYCTLTNNNSSPYQFVLVRHECFRHKQI